MCTSRQVSWNVRFNHGGGYAYRLCPNDGTTKLTEACFKAHHLDFVRDTQVSRPHLSSHVYAHLSSYLSSSLGTSLLRHAAAALPQRLARTGAEPGLRHRGHRSRGLGLVAAAAAWRRLRPPVRVPRSVAFFSSVFFRLRG